MWKCVVRGTDGIWESKSVLQLIKLAGKVGVGRTDTDKACCKVGKNHSFSQGHAVTTKCYNDPILERPLFSYWKTLFSNLIEYPKCHCLKLYRWKRNTLLCLEVQAGGAGATEDEMVGWDHWLNAHEFEQAPGDGDGQESLECCSPWGHKESDMTERLNSNSSIH